MRAHFTVEYGDEQTTELDGATDDAGAFKLHKGIPGTTVLLEVTAATDRAGETEHLKFVSDLIECRADHITDLGVVTLSRNSGE